MASGSERKTCGLIMPISTIDGLSESHWTEVLAVHSAAIEQAGFSPNLVSNADDIGIIQKRIIQNLYDNPMVVCDVSGKNPNVMFELGIRLAFDKPTIIVKDDKTSYSFDTAPIEHVQYPRDLRYAQIIEFKEKLTEKIVGTFSKASSDLSYTTFLKNFGEFTVAKLEKKEIPEQQFILEELAAIRASIQRLERPQEATRVLPRTRRHHYAFPNLSKNAKSAIDSYLNANDYVEDFVLRNQKDHSTLYIDLDETAPADFISGFEKDLSGMLKLE